MVRYSRRGDLAGPALLIGFGTLVLLINLGRAPVSLWGALSHLWPLALIVLGLDLLIPRRSVLGSVLVAALLLAVVFVGAGLALPALSNPPVAIEGEKVAVPATGEPALDISMISGAGTMRLKSMGGGDLAVSGTVSLPAGVRLEQSVESGARTTKVVLKTTGTVVVPIHFGPGEVWDLAVADEPELRVSAQMGAGEMQLDARDLNLESVEASSGAGTIEVWLPQGGSSVNVTAAMGEIVIRVLQGTPVRLKASALGGSVRVPPGYQKINGVYLSPGFASGDHIEIDASLVFGMISLLEQ